MSRLPLQAHLSVCSTYISSFHLSHRSHRFRRCHIFHRVELLSDIVSLLPERAIVLIFVAL